MNFENIPPVFGWILIAAVVAAPSAYKLTKTLVEARRIRKRIKNTPGPLLGVLYPDRFNTPTKEDTGR